VHASDGRWYEGSLLELREGSAIVRFQGETETAEVELDFIRPKVGASAERKRKAAAAEAAAAEEAKRLVPKSLEILPGDSEDTIEKKKKKLKMFKRQEKKAALETQGEGRRS